MTDSIGSGALPCRCLGDPLAAEGCIADFRFLEQAFEFIEQMCHVCQTPRTQITTLHFC